MATFLVMLSLGPVQSLIGAARRTRDLWCGSWLLSEASRAAAWSLHDFQSESLIFPCLNDPESALAPQDSPGNAANIANVLLARFVQTDETAVRCACNQAQIAATNRLKELGETAYKKAGGKPQVNRCVWDAQVGDILESFSAWTRIGDEEDAYKKALDRIGSTMAARKATRDFQPSAWTKSGHRKSSLDGAFETVLEDNVELGTRRKLRLSDGEQLDALGLMKRLAGDSEQFTAYSRIAADPWIQQLKCEDPCRLKALCLAYEVLVGTELATRVSGNDGAYTDLPYDAQMLYDFRLENALEVEKGYKKGKKGIAALKGLQTVLADIRGNKELSKPVPYAAILKADGDRMGALLSQATAADESRQISKSLHEFASAVRKKVRAHRGHAIYAGGDDVLAMIPLENALPCAKALAEDFANALRPVAEQLCLSRCEWPTLSVGIGIGHLMEPLGKLRARADEAEHLAKGDATSNPRNAVGVVLGVRAGAELTWRAQWTDHCAINALDSFMKAYRAEELSSRTAYDLRRIDLQLAWLREDADEDAENVATGIRESEATRMLARKKTKDGQAIPQELRELILKRLKAEGLHTLADTLIIARWLSARTNSDLGERW